MMSVTRSKQGAALVLGMAVALSLGAAADTDPAALPARPVAKTAPVENEMEILVAQALDQKTTLDVKEMPIRDALQKLSDKTGIPIEMEMHTVWLLPYGSQTLLTATIQDRPLRDSLDAVLRPLGLRFVAERGRVSVIPGRALRRIARRATWQEMATLETLSTKPWSRELFDGLKIQFQDSSAEDINANRQTLWRLASAVGAGKAGDVLEHATDQYGWTWYPAGDHIVILSKTKEVERQLQRRIAVKYEQANLKDVLLDLANWAGVLLRIDPGALATTTVNNTSKFSLSMENGTVRQALEIVAGETGLGYFIEPDGIRITTNTAGPPSAGSMSVQADEMAKQTASILRSNSIVGQITIPGKDGTSFAFFVRESDLPADVNELRKAKVKEAAVVMRRILGASSQASD